MCVCERERERERERDIDCIYVYREVETVGDIESSGCMREGRNMCVCVWVWICVDMCGWVCVCVCVGGCVCVNRRLRKRGEIVCKSEKCVSMCV